LKKIKNRLERQTELFDIQKLDDPKFREDFLTNIIHEIKKEYLDCKNDDIERLWSGIRNVIDKTAEKIVKEQRRVKKPWFNQI